MMFRDAYRALKATPLVSAAAILSLTLGIGANTAIFSLLNSLLLKPLPVQQPHQIVVVTDGGKNPYFALSYPVWNGIRDRRVFDRAFAWATDRVNLSNTSENRFASTIWASGEVFDVLGVLPFVGRTFDRRDDRRDSPNGPVAVISYGFWQRQFNGSSDVIGRPLNIERVGFTVVGVTPPNFFGLNVGDTFDVMLPIETQPLLGRIPKCLENSTCTWLQVMGRRSPGQTATSLSAALAAAQSGIREATMPAAFTLAENRARYFASPWLVEDAPGGFSRFRRQYGPALLTLLWIVGFVLLIACANIATLMLGRSAGRRFEFSVRLALGASRARLVSQLLIESLLLSAVGALLGYALAQWGSQVLVAQLSTWYSVAFLDLSVDWRVLAVTAFVTVSTAVLFGLVPAYRSVRVAPVEALKRAPGRRGSSVFGLGGGLVIGQVALSLVLVVGGGLFLRSFTTLAYRDLGFERNRVLVTVIDAKRSAIPALDRSGLYERIRQAAAGVPGVASAALSLATPLGNAGMRFTPEITVPGNAALAGATVRILTNPVSPGWFRTFGTRILAGRDFTDADRPGAPNVVIVNEAFARAYLAGGSPVGRSLLEGGATAERQPLEIVGLVEDAAFATVRDRIEPTIYKPLAQRLDVKLLTSMPSISLSIRAADGFVPSRLSGSVAAAIAGIDPQLSLTFQTVREQLDAFYIRERLLALLSGFFGFLGLVLAAVGLYGATAHGVSQRRTEVGIRLALGATPGSVIRLVLSRVSLLVTLGVLAGSAISLYAGRYIGSLLYDLQPRDPATLATAAAIMAGSALVAGWLPAWRAGRTDPASVLRQG